MKPFVANRVKEILKETVIFHYVPSNENPADFPTRGLSAVEISQATSWWHGPSWLKSPETTWPQWCIPQFTSDISKETETAPKEMISLTSHDVDGQNAEKYSVCTIDDKKHSTLRKFLRITVYCLKFIKLKVWNVLSYSTRVTFGEKYKLLAHVLNCLMNTCLVCASDIKMTTLLWIYSIQHRQFTDVFVSISKAKKHCLIHQLGLGVDDLGILRCYGRFMNVEA